MLVEMGFGVWEGGRHRASARWTDVQPLSRWLPLVATTGTTGDELVLFERVR